MPTDIGVPGCTDAEIVGVGGFGSVYRARQPAFGRTVAVKVLQGSVGDEGVLRRFERECRAIGSLSGHPNILVVFDAGETTDGHPFLVTDFMGKGSFADRLSATGPLPWADAVRIGVKLAGALETAHQAGVLHRDLKPENVLVSDYGEPMLADFGIARLQDASQTVGAVVTTTFAHASPELLAGGKASVSSDVYALASTVHALITGSPPFVRPEDESVLPLLARIASDTPPDLRQGGVPDSVARAVEAGLAKNPAERPPSALVFGQLLQAAERAVGQPVTAIRLPADATAEADDTTVKSVPGLVVPPSDATPAARPPSTPPPAAPASPPTPAPSAPSAPPPLAAAPPPAPTPPPATFTPPPAPLAPPPVSQPTPPASPSFPPPPHPVQAPASATSTPPPQPFTSTPGPQASFPPTGPPSGPPGPPRAKSGGIGRGKIVAAGVAVAALLGIVTAVVVANRGDKTETVTSTTTVVSTSTTQTSVTTSSAPQPLPALLVKQGDLPDGFKKATFDTDGDDKAFCNEPIATSEAQFEGVEFDRDTPLGVVTHQLARFPGTDATATFRTWVDSAQKCTTWTQPSDSGDETWSVQTRPGPDLGDETAWYLLSIEFANGAKAQAITVLDRHGDTLSYVSFAAQAPLGGRDTSFGEQLARIVARRLKGGG